MDALTVARDAAIIYAAMLTTLGPNVPVADAVDAAEALHRDVLRRQRPHTTEPATFRVGGVL